jgi:hypothetical protein
MNIALNQFKNSKFITALLCCVVLVGGVLFILEKQHIINLYGKKNSANDPKTTSTVATAQDTFTDGNPREAGNTLSENKGSAVVSDTNGAINSNIDTSHPTVSKTGEISVFTPQSNALVNSGFTVSGLSSLSLVSYRVIDDVSGVISTGELRVVDGKFSGTLGFSTTAATGRIDFFGTKFDGTEYSSVEITVRFK